jgi:RimJ/RimL family protein N-acetyltransferase
MNNIDRPFNWARACTTINDTRSVRLSDGARVHLRASRMNSQDDAAFRRLFFTLSDTTRYLYFCAGIPANEQWAERFASLGHTDGDRSYVLVAEVDDELVGFARFSQGPHADPQEHAADMGIVLTDAWQGRGLGGHMLYRLTAEAQAREVTTLSTVVLWENRRMLRLAQRIFPDMRTTYANGSCELSIDLESWWRNQDVRKCG